MVREEVERELKYIGELTGKEYSTTYWKGSAGIFVGNRPIVYLDGKPEMTEDESFTYLLTSFMKSILIDLDNDTKNI